MNEYNEMESLYDAMIEAVTAGDEHPDLAHPREADRATFLQRNPLSNSYGTLLKRSRDRLQGNSWLKQCKRSNHAKSEDFWGEDSLTRYQDRKAPEVDLESGVVMPAQERVVLSQIETILSEPHVQATVVDGKLMHASYGTTNPEKRTRYRN